MYSSSSIMHIKGWSWERVLVFRTSKCTESFGTKTNPKCPKTEHNEYKQYKKARYIHNHVIYMIIIWKWLISWLPNFTKLFQICFLAFQRFPPTRIRRPVNRRAGSVINSGIKRGRFNVKQTNTNAKPMPNLAKFPGIHKTCILLKLRCKISSLQCNVTL